MEGILNSTEHLLRKNQIHHVLFGKEWTHYMLVTLVNLDVLFLNLDTDLHGKLRSREVTRWAKRFHING